MMESSMVRGSTVKRKLTIIIMVTSVSVLFLACVAFIVFQLLHLRRAMVNDLKAHAAILGDSCAFALSFDEPLDADVVLEKLKAKPSITFAGIYNRDNEIFSYYVRSTKRAKLPVAPLQSDRGIDHPPADLTPDKQKEKSVSLPALHMGEPDFVDGYLNVSLPIIHSGEHIGTVFVQSDLHELYTLLRRNSAVVLLVMFFSSLMAFLLSSRLQRVISHPIMELARTAKIVSEKKDYSLQVKRESEDEVGVLIDSFNEMLSQIKTRDQALVQEKERAESVSRELAQHRDQLEDLVRQRTEELAISNEELQFEISQRVQTEEQAKVLLNDLERANRELEDFAYIASHDLKSPLRGISSVSTWFAEDYGELLDETGHEYLNDLLVRTQRMHNLIEGILEYSRVGRGRSKLEPLDSEIVVQEVIDTLIPPVHIAIKINGKLPTVVYDRTQLHELFQNLIGNAIKYLGKPLGEIWISCKDLGKYWEFCVRDTGIGIEERHFERIFKIFQTLQPRADDDASTGIGLALVKKIAERQGGSVRVESVVGEGCSFYFTIAKDLSMGATDIKRTVLIVDNNVDFAGIVAKMLEHAGYKSLHAPDGHNARELLRLFKGNVDLTILDLKLSGENILELYEELKDLRPNMRVAACTSRANGQEAEPLIQAGVDGVLYKPFKTEDLNRILRMT